MKCVLPLVFTVVCFMVTQAQIEIVTPNGQVQGGIREEENVISEKVHPQTKNPPIITDVLEKSIFCRPGFIRIGRFSCMPKKVKFDVDECLSIAVPAGFKCPSGLRESLELNEICPMEFIKNTCNIKKSSSWFSFRWYHVPLFLLAGLSGCCHSKSKKKSSKTSSSPKNINGLSPNTTLIPMKNTSDV